MFRPRVPAEPVRRMVSPAGGGGVCRHLSSSRVRLSVLHRRGRSVATSHRRDLDIKVERTQTCPRSHHC